MMDALRTYLQQYPGLRGGVIHMDSLPMDGRHFSLSSAPCNPILRTYMDGGYGRYQAELKVVYFQGADF